MLEAGGADTYTQRAIPGSEGRQDLCTFRLLCPLPLPDLTELHYQLGFLCRPGFHRGRSYVPDADPGGLGSLTSQNSSWLPVCRK